MCADVNKDGLVLTGNYNCPRTISIDGDSLHGKINTRDFCDGQKQQWLSYLDLNPDSTLTYEDYLHNNCVTLMWRIADIEYEFNNGKLTTFERQANIEVCKEAMAAIWARFPSVKRGMNMNFINMPDPNWVKILRNHVEVTGIEQAYKHK